MLNVKPAKLSQPARIEEFMGLPVLLSHIISFSVRREMQSEGSDQVYK
ncbi:MAG TPA: hypothetical protein VHF65_05770 [Nitrososphaera sp.]|nr:hypothetical protein [Nitrososphaera sp.]